MLDPPRQGCDEATLRSVTMSPRRWSMSAATSTAARDAKWLEEHGYRAEKGAAGGPFSPRTRHVEAIVSLKRNLQKLPFYVIFSVTLCSMARAINSATNALKITLFRW